MPITIVKYLAFLSFAASMTVLANIYLARYHNKISTIFKKNTPEILKRYQTKKRIKKLEAQLVDTVYMLSNSLKAGLSLQQAFQMVSLEGPSPMKEEFTVIINHIKLGRSFKEAVIEWQSRVPIDDISILVESILVLFEAGGNLVETFTSIALTITERQKIRGKIKVLTMQGLSQAAVLVVLPFVLGICLYLVAAWYVEPLLENWLGWVLIGVAITLQTAGALWMRKIVDIKV